MRLESLANLAHELRTPVQVLTGYLEILRENLSHAADSATREIVKRMNANTHELAQTIENLMEHVMAEADVAGPATADEVPLRSLVAEIAPVLEAANSSKHLKVSFDLTQAAETIHAPRQVLRSILLNLALNAIKFTDSGSVTIAVRRPGDAIGEEHVIEISDTGPGMSRWMLVQALKPFAQLSRGSDRRHRGLGLGLTVTQRNVAALGGRLELRSIVGQGSRFTVRIPVPAQLAAPNCQPRATVRLPPVGARLSPPRTNNRPAQPDPIALSLSSCLLEGASTASLIKAAPTIADSDASSQPPHREFVTPLRAHKSVPSTDLPVAAELGRRPRDNIS